MKCKKNVSIYNRFMSIVLFDVIYCLIVTSKHTHNYMQTEEKKSKVIFSLFNFENTLETKKKQEKEVSE